MQKKSAPRSLGYYPVGESWSQILPQWQRVITAVAQRVPSVCSVPIEAIRQR